jgi:hypothetical protein
LGFGFLNSFVFSSEAKLFAQFNRLALEVSETEVFATIEAERRAAVPLEVSVPPPEAGANNKEGRNYSLLNKSKQQGPTIISYSTFPALDHSLYKKLIPTVKSSSNQSKIFSDISRKVRLLADEGASQERIVVVDTMYNLVKSLRAGETDVVLAVERFCLFGVSLNRGFLCKARAEAWFRGNAVETATQVYDKRSPRLPSPPVSVKKKMMAMAKKLRSPQFKRNSATAASERAPAAPGEAKWRNPDSWESDSGPPGLEQREHARESMKVFLQILRLYCDAGEVRFQRTPCRDLGLLLESVVKNSDAGLRLAQQDKQTNDTHSSADEDTETGVVVCWACGEARTVFFVWLILFCKKK